MNSTNSENELEGDGGRWSQEFRDGGGGFELAFSGVIFALAGVWIDRQLGTTPLFIIALSVLGFAGAVLNIYYRYIRDITQIEAEIEATRRGRTQ